MVSIFPVFLYSAALFTVDHIFLLKNKSFLAQHLRERIDKSFCRTKGMFSKLNRLPTE
jgi:hypothetical protein